MNIEQLIELIREVIREELRAARTKEFLLISEASELTRFAKGSLYNMVRRRKIPFIKPEGKLLFVHDDLVKWMLATARAPRNENRRLIGEKQVRVG